MRKTRKNEQRESQLDYSTMMDELGANVDYADIYAHDFFQGRERSQLQEHKPWENQMMWNYFLVREMYDILKRKKWVMPFVHGNVDFMNFEAQGHKITLLLIARRSRHYAGTRYLRRGINQEGRPANFVEIEQIMYEHMPCFNDASPKMTSVVQIRGSIPFFWSQIPSAITVKPDIILDKSKDPNMISTRKHFGRLLQKYSHPLFCLNLTKRNNAREETVAREFRNFVTQDLKQEMPAEYGIKFIHWDMKEKKRNKEKRYEIDMLEHARDMIGQTNIFSCIPSQSTEQADDSLSRVEIQRGVVRTNCIDSLDRTNQV